ncbi:hypothetical protein E2F50_12125 [Rhizobium deserti]|uniref:AP2/ERF domain-containing protein n=2 Tax=Rhizobium deserti TaxID=2547961 RepID=A0A4R5UIE7_9HYPH|nr:hypothetical protein E2F50_12125 [Rhizobium deserti]
MAAKARNKRGQNVDRIGDDADSYALTREEPNKNRGAGWSVGIRRRGHRIVRLFKDSIYGSSEASYAEARAYRDAVISALPPPTNVEQAVLLRRNNQSGISGVRLVDTKSGEAWQATLMTKEGQKRETYPISKYGSAAKSMAISQRTRWLADLPVKHLAYAHHAEEVTRQTFEDQLTPATDVMQQVQISEQEVLARLADINARFDTDRPPRLKVRVKSYGKGRLSVAVSDGGQPAQRKLIQLNTASLAHGGLLVAAGKIQEIITEFYSADVAAWFAQEHAKHLLDPDRFNATAGLNVTLWVPRGLSFCAR